MKGFLDMFFPKRPCYIDKINEATNRNASAKREFLHKAERGKTAFDDLAKSLREKRQSRE